MTPDDERLLQDLLCGDADDDAPTVQARLGADPALAQRLAELRAAAARITASMCDGDSATPAAGDRARIAAALRPWPVRRLHPSFVVGAVAATLLAAVLVWHRTEEPHRVDGSLGSATGVEVFDDAGRWRLIVHEALPPGASYHLRLDLADGTSSTATAEAHEWSFPADWNDAVRRASTARLVIEWDDGTGLFVRRVLPLR